MKIFGWLLSLGLVIATSAFADESIEILQNRLHSMQHQVLLDRQSNQIAQEQLHLATKLRQQDAEFYKTHQISKAILNHSDLELTAAQARLQGVDIILESAKQQLADTVDRIDELARYQRQQTLLLKDTQDSEQKLADIARRMTLLRQLKAAEIERLSELQTNRVIAQQRMDWVVKTRAQQNRLFQKQEQNRVLEASSKQMAALQSRLQGWLVSLENLQSQLSLLSTSTESFPKRQRELQIQILTAEEHIALLRTQITLLRTEYQIEELRVPVRKIHSVAQLNNLEVNAKKILDELAEINSFTVTKNKFIDLKKAEIKQSLSNTNFANLSTLLNGLQSDYYAINFKITQLENQTQAFAKNISVLLKNELAVRQTLPPFTLSAWSNLGEQFVAAGGMIVHSGQGIISQIKMSFGTLALLIGGLVLSWLVLRYVLKLVSQQLIEKRGRFVTNVLYTACEIIRRSLFSILLFVLMSMFSISFGLFQYLLGTYILFKSAIVFARIALVETGTDAQLYHRLKRTLIFGGILSAFVVITHALPVDYEIKALSNRVFMLFVLILGIFLFIGRKILPNLFTAMIPGARRYVHLVLDLLMLLIPLALISNAIIGLCGYVELAFVISSYQGIFLIVLAGYLIIRGILIDSMEYLSEILIRYTNSGWVLTEAFVKPLDKILRLLLLVGTLWLLAHFYGLDNNTTFLTGLHNVFHYTLFDFVGNAITLLVLIKIILIGLALFWIARWSREFCFRRLYAKAKDAGVRNSLSIFSQYGIVIVGVLLGLKILGLDLTGFAVVAAAFAAGIGFGLRDLANNFFSGILLLIERPFRTGDIVTLGDYEGEVVHTGLRSMMIRTWDRMEVIVPNADMFTKPFTNWTHQDSIVRTVIKIKIHRQDDPHKVQQVILDTLKKNKAVVDKPEVEIFMQEIDDALMEMHIRYYMVISPKQSRAKVRSDVLFALWDAFKENNIKPPYQQFNVELQDRDTL